MTIIGVILGIAATEVLGAGFFHVVGVPASPAMFTFLAILGAAAGASGRYIVFR